MATLKDIAKIAGVNKSTVSRALNRSPGVSEKKRAQILGIAEELGYVPNEMARMLAGKNGRSIGIIVPEIDCSYYASVVGTIEKMLKEKGYSIIIGQSGFDFQNELHYLDLFIRKKVNGIIFNLYNTKDFTEQYEKIKKIIKVPIVFIEASINLDEYDTIEIDNNCGVTVAVEHLIRTGCRRIGFISEYLSCKMRYLPFEETLRKAGIPIYTDLIKIGKERFEEGGYIRMKELIAQKPLPDAVFASYDTMALGAMKALAESGIRVPGDISIIGFDNIRESSYFAVPLTTVSPPVMKMSRAAVGTLLDKIENRGRSPVKHISLKPELILRSSTRKFEKE